MFLSCIDIVDISHFEVSQLIVYADACSAFVVIIFLSVFCKFAWMHTGKFLRMEQTLACVRPVLRASRHSHFCCNVNTI